MGPKGTKLAITATLAIVMAAGALLWLRREPPAAVPDLLDHLPPGDAVTAWIDVAALRSGGVLDLVAGYKPVEASEYAAFVSQSGFDYRSDLDGVLLTLRGDDVYLLLSGRFPWAKLEQYATNNGGSCDGGLCRMAGSRPNRNISFSQVRQGVMALAVSPSPMAVTEILEPKQRAAREVSKHPVWVSLPPAELRKSPAILPGTRAFASALAQAETITLSLGPNAGRFEALLDVTCPTAGEAAFLQLRLQEATELLKTLIARENKQPNPGDLSGVLTAGTFGRNDRQVWGRWPIERSFVQALAGGTL